MLMLYVCSDEVQGKSNAFKALIGVPTDAEHHNTTLITSVQFTVILCSVSLNMDDHYLTKNKRK